MEYLSGIMEYLLGIEPEFDNRGFFEYNLSDENSDEDVKINIPNSTNHNGTIYLYYVPSFKYIIEQINSVGSTKNLLRKIC